MSKSRFPRTTTHVKDSFTKTIDGLVASKMCRGEKLAENELPSIRVDGYGTGERTKVGSTTEKSFGDKEQDGTESSLYLGNYSIVVKDVNTCFSECSQAGCSKSYAWTAKILVIDGLGINPGNIPVSEDDPDVWKWWEFYFAEQNVFGQERAVVVASWEISGKGCCKK
ncbi:MAG: hypothetical protein MUF81_16495 [Verrucomicrobia bacterium]|jgi:hypothetical protein|nr:hypothetical protein [Verrucomicrobiota bacterium]